MQPFGSVAHTHTCTRARAHAHTHTHAHAHTHARVRENQRERVGSIILRWIFIKWEMGVWNRLTWLKLGSGGGLLCMQ